MWFDHRRTITCRLLLNLLAAGFFFGGKGYAAEIHRHSAPKHQKPPVKKTLPPSVPTLLSSSDLFGEEDEAEEVGLQGLASYYSNRFAGRKTASGERYDPQVFGAASNRFPLGTRLIVRRLDNSRCVIVRINDRMHPKHQKRIIDLSYGVAKTLDMLRHGVILVRVEPLKAHISPNCVQTE